MAFDALHAPDIAGGMISGLLVLLFLSWQLPLGIIILNAVAPLVVSTALLFFVRPPCALATRALRYGLPSGKERLRIVCFPRVSGVAVEPLPTY